MIPDGAWPNSPVGACSPGSTGRQTGNATTIASAMNPIRTALTRRISGVSRGSRATRLTASWTGASARSPAATTAATSGHHATPRTA